MVDSRQGEVVLWAMLVDWSVVDAHSSSMSFLGTSTGLAIQVDFFVSQMNWASSNRLTSSPIALRLGSEKRLRACFTGFVFGLMRRACSANSRGILGMSA